MRWPSSCFMASPAWAPVAGMTRLRSRSGRRLDVVSSGGVGRVIGLVMTVPFGAARERADEAGELAQDVGLRAFDRAERHDQVVGDALV
jgi:hypothetical protein